MGLHWLNPTGPLHSDLQSNKINWEAETPKGSLPSAPHLPVPRPVLSKHLQAVPHAHSALAWCVTIPATFMARINKAKLSELRPVTINTQVLPFPKETCAYYT